MSLDLEALFIGGDSLRQAVKCVGQILKLVGSLSSKLQYNQSMADYVARDKGGIV